MKRSSHWYLLHQPVVFSQQVHKLLSLYFIHTSASPQQFLYVHICEPTFYLPAERTEWDASDHEKPHPIKTLKSKYLNCSWALVCVLEKFLNFVSLPTDFTVQVPSRKKWAVKHSLRITRISSCRHCLHQKAPAVWDYCIPRGWDLKWPVAAQFSQQQALCA